MSLLIDVDGKPAMPLRAIPFVSGGLIDGRSICLYTVDHKLNPYWPKITPFALDARNRPVETPLGMLARMSQEMDEVELRNGTIKESRECIPPGVYAWEAEVLEACSTYRINLSRWNTSPFMNKDELAFVQESGPFGRTLEPTPRKLDKSDFDPEIQRLAERVKIDLVKKLRRNPTKGEIAEQLKKDGTLGNVKTIVRRFRKSAAAS